MDEVTSLPIEAMRAAILEVQPRLRAHPDAVGQEAFALHHHFAPGTYAREIELPAGSLVVGRIHRHAHVNVISKGYVLVATPDGAEELRAPKTFISAPGTKRVVYAVEDTVWTTVHLNEAEERDPDKLVETLTAPTFEALDAEAALAIGVDNQ